jgi:hypothetical protein
MDKKKFHASLEWPSLIAKCKKFGAVGIVPGLISPLKLLVDQSMGVCSIGSKF